MQNLPAEFFNCCVTSPPYLWVRDYGVPPSEWPSVAYTQMAGLPPITVPDWTGCLGLEPTVEMFVGHIVLVFREVWRVLRDDGTLWLNFGDTYEGSMKGRNADGAGNPGGMHKQHRGQFAGTIIPKEHKAKYLKPKDLIGIPWRVAFALQADGWYLRMDNIWSKPNCMPESVTDRPTKAHEYMFLLSKNSRYYYDSEAIKEPLTESSIARLSQDLEQQAGSTRANGEGKTNGSMKAVGGSKGAFGPEQSRKRSGNTKRKYGDERGRPESHLGGTIPWEGSTRNKRSVWKVATAQTKEAHFAAFPEKLIEPCILAGCPVGGHVLDPFGGIGTARKVALENNRKCTLIDINPDYIDIQKRRTAVIQPKLL
ncbi:site-specific DNA-methyltransferase [Paenibacillus sp. N5-1-1-5]|uniref:Methyltransferase n=2 Tax=Paenibacillus radicis (ex Xue et al. 2023) TaxID=2972489 RepID=A0ABT1YJV8_9BACL|nr:site-specific DNA-methyltransferase [Paenibacillus radicis (ex Xue et al. 2023)]MCR8633456.1 site-specific DNA-methyltransferase [Paenibacillus radicis (ex Xue et al. 2023)]